MSILKRSGVLVFTLALTLATALAASAQSAPKTEDYIKVMGKIISIDTSKGDVSTRLEFEPHGKFANEDGSLTKNIKFDTASANGKQEITFDKGKRIPPTEVVLNMYDGEVTDYPFDKHKAQLIFFFTVKPDKDKPKPAAETHAEGEEKPAAAPAEEEDDEIDVPFTLDFEPKMAGYTFTETLSKDSDDTFVDLEIGIARSPMITLFSVFIMVLMWAVTIAVVCLIFTVVIKKRKAEIAMFSFIATLLFAFVQVRNAQPGVPPVGTYSDYLSFFWVEAILGLCLVAVVLTWVFRKPA